MNLIHLRCAIEIARLGSINKAAEVLLMAPPNISRNIKELEAELGTSVFYRTSRGMSLTPDGERFIGYARNIIGQVDDVKKIFESEVEHKQHFSVSVPRATYIAEAFANFSKGIDSEYVEIFYNETNSSGAVKNILESDYKLGIVRYAEHHDRYFKSMFEEKGLSYELVSEFNYVLVMNKESPLARLQEIHFDNLTHFTEIAHADPFVPSLPLNIVKKEELPDNIGKRIFVFERASQFELLAKNPQTFMWVSPLPDETLDRFGLIQVTCPDNRKVYKDVLIHRENYVLSELDKRFITEVCNSKRRYL